MIKKLAAPTSHELDQLMTIWLQSNIEAHSFIEESYWQKHEEIVRQALPEAELFTYSIDGKIIGFLGLMNGYIAGLFIDTDYRGQGIGRQLLDQVKKETGKLSLAVYQKNHAAYQFYLKQGFRVMKEMVNEETNEKEYLMEWEEY